jgi:hypothetical protein
MFVCDMYLFPLLHIDETFIWVCQPWTLSRGLFICSLPLEWFEMLVPHFAYNIIISVSEYQL